MTVASLGTPLQVHLEGAFLVAPQGPGHFGQGGQDGPVHGGQPTQGFGFTAVQQRRGLCGQIADDGAEQRGVEDPAGLAQGTQGRTLTAEPFLHFGQGAGLLQAAQAGEDGAEEG